MIILSAILLVSVIAKYFCDRIRFKANFKSDWMIGAGKYIWYKRTWLMKYPLSFLSDGWHNFDFWRVLMLSISLSLLWISGIDIVGLIANNFWTLLLTVIVIYIIHGLIFETLYRIK